MRNNKMFLPGVLLATAVLFSGGCGRQSEPVSAEPTETVKEVAPEESRTGSEGEENSVSAESEKPVDAESTDTPEPVETAEPTQTPESVETAESTRTPESVETAESTRTSEPALATEPDADKEPAETTEPVTTKKPGATEKPTGTEKPTETEKPAATEKPAGTPKPSETLAQSQASTQPETPAPTEIPVQPSQSETPVQPETPAQPSQPVHEHVWKEHTAITQTWIPNIVVVEDYGEIPGEAYDYFICSCGYETEDADAIRTHYKEGVRAGTCINFGIQTRYRESTYGVIGTHEEDQGHYETSSYVDYYYCDCGATK